MESNFYTSIKPLVTYLNIIGIVPYNFKNNKLHLSRFNVFYVMILLAIYATLLYFAIRMVHVELDATTATAHVLHIIVAVSQVAITLLNTIFQRGKFMELYKIIITCQGEFREIVDFPYGKIRHRMYKDMGLRLFGLLVTYAVLLNGFKGTYRNEVVIFIGRYFLVSVFAQFWKEYA